MGILGYTNYGWLIVSEMKVQHLKQSPFICRKLKLMDKVSVKTLMSLLLIDL